MGSLWVSKGFLIDVSCRVVIACALQRSGVLPFYYILLSSTARWNAVLLCIALYWTVLCFAVQCSIRRGEEEQVH